MSFAFSTCSRRPKLLLWLAIILGASLVFLASLLQRSTTVILNVRHPVLQSSLMISYPSQQHRSTPGYPRDEDRRHSAVDTTKRTNQTILTLFTSFKDSPNREPVHRSTIENWSRLRPFVQPVLYTVVPSVGPSNRNHALEQFARDRGWRVLRCDGTSEMGVPVLKWMFQHAISAFHSSYYGYANGDILFDAGLIQTLTDLSEVVNRLPTLLIIGARTDCPQDKCFAQKSPHQQRHINISGMRLHDPRVLHQEQTANHHRPEVHKPTPEVLKRIPEGVLKSAQDYFLTTRSGFEWRTIPEFVIGRAGYDNWIVVTALVRGVAVIDASATVQARHQMIDGENHSSHFDQPKTNDSRVNYDLAGRGFDYSVGVMDCAPMETVLEKAGDGSKGTRVVLRQRELSRYCKRNLVKNHRIRPSSLLRHLHRAR